MTSTKHLIPILFVALFVFNSCGLFDSNNQSNEDSVFYPVLISGEWGYINNTGSIVIEPQFQIANPFSEGLAAVRYQWRWMYIDETGEPKIDGNGVYQNLGNFSEGLGAVQIEGRIGFMNKDAEFVINPRFRDVTSFSDNRSFVRSLNYRRYHFIDANGEEIPLPAGIDSFDNDEFSYFSNKRALVHYDDRYGFIDTEGNVIVQNIYQEALPFSENLAAVKVSDRWGFINTSGDMEITPQFVSVGSFNDNRAAVRKSSNLYGFINSKAEMVISEQFEEVRNFSNGLAAVKLGEKWGFISTEGVTIVTPQFDAVDDFYQELARFMILIPTEDGQDEAFGYLNKEGIIVWPATR
jgi:hypothetical protein